MSDDPRAGIKLLIDEDVSPWVAQRLREDDLIDAIHVRDRSRLGNTDEEVLAFAFSEDRIVVTANVRDFEMLACATEIHPGVVVILDGNLLRLEQLDVVHMAVNAIAQEIAAGNDMVNRVLRIAMSGSIEFIDLPKPT